MRIQADAYICIVLHYAEFPRKKSRVSKGGVDRVPYRAGFNCSLAQIAFFPFSRFEKCDTNNVHEGYLAGKRNKKKRIKMRSWLVYAKMADEDKEKDEAREIKKSECLRYLA